MSIPTAPPISGSVFKQKMFQLKGVRSVGNIKLRFEGFGEEGMDEMAGFTKAMCDALPARSSDDKLGRNWFGAWWQKAKMRINLVDRYLKQRCWTITFVRKISGAKCDNCRVEASDYGQVLPTVITDAEGRVRKQDFYKAGAELDIPRGLRIFISPYFHRCDDPFERLNCVFHEITHKVIGTHDFEYGIPDCLALAKNDSKKALANADNYGYWLAAKVSAAKHTS